MKKFSKFYFILLLATLISFTACSETISKESVEASLQYAESAIENDNAEDAVKYVKQYADSAIFDELSIDQLGRLSMIVMRISDDIDQAANVTLATDIFDHLYKVNADSATAFYNSIEPDRMQFVETMRHNSVARRTPMDISSIPEDEYFDIDSLIMIDSLKLIEQ